MSPKNFSCNNFEAVAEKETSLRTERCCTNTGITHTSCCQVQLAEDEATQNYCCEAEGTIFSHLKMSDDMRDY